MSGEALCLTNISKAFDGQAALERACFAVEWGELHALTGENGAGKSTLMNIVSGLYTADDGNIRVNGQPVSIAGPGDASRYGIGMVHQHFKLVGPFSVAENILLACSKKLRIASLAEAIKLTRETAATLGFGIDPQARTADLSIAERQRIEIIKLILLGADILIFDEPTAVLTDAESDTVLSLLRAMAAQGKAVILITHRLREVSQYADRITIMRNGKTVHAGAAAKSLDKSDLARAMVGDTLQALDHDKIPQENQTAATRLELQNVHVQRSNGSTAVNNLSLHVRAGEILGVVGVGGNGQTELAEAIFGLQDIASGSISIDGQDLSGLAIAQRRQLGLRLVPADRYSYALLVSYLMLISRFGFYLNAVGLNPRGAKAAGLPVTLIVVCAVLIAGGLCGLAGYTIVAGQEYRLTQHIAHGYTFSAILIAFLARFNPVAVIPVAFIVAGLFTAGDTLKTFYQLPLALILVVESLILLAVVAVDFFARYRISWSRVDSAQRRQEASDHNVSTTAEDIT